MKKILYNNEKNNIKLLTKTNLYGIIIHVVAGMVELADTSVLEADAERREGSSPFTRTKFGSDVKSEL